MLFRMRVPCSLSLMLFAAVYNQVRGCGPAPKTQLQTQIQEYFKETCKIFFVFSHILVIGIFKPRHYDKARSVNYKCNL